MSVLAKTLGFSLALTGLFTVVTYLVPQVEGEAPVEQTLDLSSMTMDGFITLGEDLFHNKGTCTLCHKAPPLGRAPDIAQMDMQLTSEERLADPRYQGEADDVVSYLMESMVAPSAYVVTGWGKKGSNDTESPMPAVQKAPISLSPLELDALIAYMQAKDGHEVTVALPTHEDTDAHSASAEETDKTLAAPPAPAATADEALAKYACSACHALDSTDALVGPGFAGIGARMSREQIRSAIIDQNAEIAEGFPPAMPSNFAEQMTVSELRLVVQYLVEKR